MDPPAEAPPPPPQPLKLTQRELKKLRTQRRLARDKEKQELIRQGRVRRWTQREVGAEEERKGL